MANSSDLLRYRYNPSRDLQEFNGKLREDPILKDAFQAALIVAVALSNTRPGSSTSSTTIRAEGYLEIQRGLFAGRLNEYGELQNALRMAFALFGTGEHIRPLTDLVSTLFARRNEVEASGSNFALAQEVLGQGLIEDGTIIDYLLTLESRRHAQALASNLVNALAESPGFRNGLQLVGERPPTGLLENRKFNDAIRLFDRDVLVAVYLLRLCNANIAFNGAKSLINVNDPATQAFIGPTAGTLDALETCLLLEFFKQLPPEKSATILNRCKALTQSLNIANRDFADLPSCLSMLNLLKETAEALTRVENIQTEQRSIVDAAHKLLALDLPSASKDEVDTWISTPLPFALFYSYPLPNSPGAEGSTLALDFCPGLLEVHALDQTGIGTQWVIDKRGTWRTPKTGPLIPLMSDDLEPDSNRDFAQLHRIATDAGFLVFDSLISAWKRFPTLFSTSFPHTKLVRMLDSAGALTIQISPADKDQFLQSVDLERFKVIQIADPTSSTDSLTFQIQYAEIAEVPPEEATPEPGVQRVINDHFMSRYCQNFDALLRILRRLGVGLEPGKGSHEHLTLNGYKETTSKKLRNGIIAIDQPLVRQILAQLHISESQFVRAATREDRK